MLSMWHNMPFFAILAPTTLLLGYNQHRFNTGATYLLSDVRQTLDIVPAYTRVPCPTLLIKRYIAVTLYLLCAAFVYYPLELRIPTNRSQIRLDMESLMCSESEHGASHSMPNAMIHTYIDSWPAGSASYSFPKSTVSGSQPCPIILFTIPVHIATHLSACCLI
ncbi:hypothetical protein BDN70DRAFT_523408 [Pholiota conissans]|uniref:Uncharacterized protein n=1 Tax=Pholiota conissans TaxID=109636 RepID=A0A9P6D3E6_9AGAR|nr:hypothetical protein BDN70DRAFT_523408 [Pholiota conissans]